MSVVILLGLFVGIQFLLSCRRLLYEVGTSVPTLARRGVVVIPRVVMIQRVSRWPTSAEAHGLLRRIGEFAWLLSLVVLLVDSMVFVQWYYGLALLAHHRYLISLWGFVKVDDYDAKYVVAVVGVHCLAVLLVTFERFHLGTNLIAFIGMYFVL